MNTLPTEEQLQSGLKKWYLERFPRKLKSHVYPRFVEYCLKNQIGKTVSHEQFVEYCRKNDLNYNDYITNGDETSNYTVPPGYHQVQRMLNGRQTPSWSALTALLYALEIDSWTHFLDYCYTASLKTDVIPISNSMAELRRINSVDDSSPYGIPVTCVRPEDLKNIRTRIDLVTMVEGQETEFSRHIGHEYVHVLDGQIECKFGHGKDTTSLILTGTENNPPPSADEPFAIAFAASLSHSFRCISDKAQIAIGRSAKSTPTGLDLP